MTLGGLLPVLILLVGVSFIFLLMRFLSTKRIHWVLGSYLVILLIASGVYLLIPKKDHVHSEQISQNNIPNLADLVYEGKALDDVQMYIRDRWEFEYEQDQLQIVGHYKDYIEFDLLISVERKEEEDGLIEAIHYRTPIIVEGLDVTEHMNPLQVEATPSTLEISGLDRVDLKFRTYRNDFPTRQFTGENWWDDWEYTFDRQVLLLRIPKSMQITHVDDYLSIHEAQE